MRIKKTVERWFDVPDDPDGGRLKIKHLTPGEKTKIFDKVFKQEINYKKIKGKKGKKDEFEPTIIQKSNPGLIVKLTNIEAVVGWKKFFDENDLLMEECNEENVTRAYDTIENFDELVTELREQLAKDIKQEEEDQRKNSSGSALEPVK